jgi:CRP/FNR family transcriptional regulator, cyclic AMP receptor protein
MAETEFSAAAAGGGLAAALRTHGIKRSFPRGHALFTEGDLGERVFMIETGWVTLRSTGPQGEEMILALRGPGEVVGEMSAFDGAPRTATALAVDEVEAVVAPARSVAAALARDVDAANDFARILVARLRESDSQRVEFTVLDTLARVARRLLDLADRFGQPVPEGVKVELPLSQEELASWCGASREATVKALRTLREVGGITTGRRVVTLHDREALERHARVGAGG